jgi:abortive infection bacteriophage resistance protein
MKPVKNIQEQIDILKSRKIVVDNLKFATKILEYENYYTVINGYKDLFLDSTNIKDSYKTGTRFNEIVALYSFDRRLKELLLIELLRIEHSISSQIITAFSNKHGHNHTSYLRPESFNTDGFTNFKRTNALIFDLINLVKKWQYRHGAIKHYMNKHGYVPLWVLSKVMTFGKINSFYACMTIDDKNTVAESFELESALFKTLIDFLAEFRNRCAHGERIYCFRKDQDNAKHPIQIPDLHCHELLNIPKNNKGYKYGVRDILALLIAMKFFMHPSRYDALIKHINYSLYHKLEKRLSTISISDVENIMGLKNSWQILRRI